MAFGILIIHIGKNIGQASISELCSCEKSSWLTRLISERETEDINGRMRSGEMVGKVGG